MDRKFRVVVVGGVAAGPKIACKVARLRPDAEVTLVQKGRYLSYAGCGLPYYISGEIAQSDRLMLAPGGKVRDPSYFLKAKNVVVHERTEAVEIDRQSKRLRVRSIADGGERWFEYDKLALATGARPIVPSIPGVDLDNVFTLKTIEDADRLRQLLESDEAREIVVIGGGLIGLETTEAFSLKGARVTVIEMLEQVLPMLDWEIAALVRRYIESKGVRVLTSCPAEAIEGKSKVEAVRAGGRRIRADAVLVAVGVRPEVELARKAGLAIGPTGAIQVDDHMRTSDPDIYAAGDCVEVTHALTGKSAYIPLGSTANKQGRVAAVNICGGDERFPPVAGSTICKVFNWAVGCTGLSERSAREHGFDVVSCLVPGADRAGYYPTRKSVYLKLVADRTTRRLIGLQAVGPGEVAKRIDVAATAIAAGMTVDQVANLDLSYAPPYASAMDLLITAANVVRNKLDGYMEGISALELKGYLDAAEPVVLLDVRTEREWRKKRLTASKLIPLDQLRGRLDELPSDGEIVAYCASSQRAYEAALILRAAGFDNVRVLDGGIAMWPFETLSGDREDLRPERVGPVERH